MKKSLSLTLSVLLLHAFSLASLANDSPLERAKKAQLASEVKAGVMRIGTGKSAVVRVVLNDKTKYHGYITEIGEDSFVVADAKTGATAPIGYREVTGIKGNNFSNGAKIGIGVGIAAAIVVIVAVAASRDDKETAPHSPQCITTPCP
jgi:predicted small secreted protein